MTALLIIGIICLLVGGAFYWLNVKSPLQTPIPAATLPVGALLVAVWIGRQVF
jgi:hypothetical protein